MADLIELLRSALTERYRIDRELGSGGMAVVFLGEDLRHHRRVAVKVLRPELAAVIGSERFVGEIETAARLSHPHILPLHDSGSVGELLYYVMPYAEGESLRQRLDREKQLGLGDALRFASEIADALDFAHRRKVVHRDIKPENILLEENHAVVADFGIARVIDAVGGEKLTTTGLAIGTPAYMSPEQVAGSRDLDGRSDVYSLGCVLYEMLVGTPPFTGVGPAAVLARHVMDAPPSPRTVRPSLAPAVERVILKALAKVPADRFATAGQMAQAISRVAGSETETHRAPSPERRRFRGLRYALMGVFGFAALLAVFLVRDRTDRRAAATGAARSGVANAVARHPRIAVLPGYRGE